MSCIYRGAWYGPDYDAPAEAGTETFFDREEYLRIAEAPGITNSYNVIPEVAPGGVNDGYARNHPQFFRDGGQHEAGVGAPCDFYLHMIRLRPETTTDSGQERTVYHYDKVYSAQGHYFPPIETVTFTIFTELLDNSPTPDRPSQWDHYWDGYQIAMPFSGDRWRFTPNQDIDNNWWIQFVEIFTS